MTTTQPIAEWPKASLIRVFNLSNGGITWRKPESENARLWATCERIMEELDRRGMKYRVVNDRIKAI